MLSSFYVIYEFTIISLNNVLLKLFIIILNTHTHVYLY